MYSLRRMFPISLALVALTVLAMSAHHTVPATESRMSPLQSDALLGVKLGGSSECRAVSVLGTEFKGALIYGRSTDLTKLLRNVALNKSLPVRCYPECVCALLGPDCLLSKASTELVSGTLPPPPPGTVNIVLDGGDPSPPRSNRKGSDGGDSMIRLYDAAKKEAQCKTEFCASSNGELSVSASCGDVKFKVTSSGKASASVTSGNTTMTIP